MAMFSERLAELRKEKGLSQTEFGSIFKLGQSTIGMYETNKREPDAATLKKFADYFNCTVDYLLGRSETRRPYEFDELDPETIKTLTRANKLSPAAREQFKEAVKWVFELDAKERELERLKKGE